jgi:hypothetical protein
MIVERFIAPTTYPRIYLNKILNVIIYLSSKKYGVGKVLASNALDVF